MRVKINGSERLIEKNSLSVLELLGLCDVERPETVSVQLNGEFVRKEDFETAKVKESDEVDFLYFMGGGAF